MALDLTAEQKEVGQKNFNNVSLELNRRGFLKGAAAAGAAVAGVGSAAYFGYKSVNGKPLKAALIGCGDEGGVLLGEHNPEFIEFIAACDIRPSNHRRIIEGDPKVPLRKGFKKIYGEAYANKIANNHLYTDWQRMLSDEPEIEAVVIALPLHLHASVSIECMKRGKHVLCEKLMARNIKECKDMIRVARENRVILSIGHQRHYSMLYAQALEVLNTGVIGDIKHIRALWHRNFSWDWIYDPKDGELVKNVPQPRYRDGWFQPIYQEDFDFLSGATFGDVASKKGRAKSLQEYGYTSIEQLIRWRLYEQTGGGLMAELGSHQLDACSIFLGKVKPLAVSGVGTRSFFGNADDPGDKRNPRNIDDHVFATFEFPGKKHPKGPNGGGNDKDDVVVVTYSSISTNGFEQYGECLMGTRGTLIIEGEQKALLYPENQPGKKSDGPRATTVTATSGGGGKPVMEASSTWGGPAPAASGATSVSGGMTSSSSSAASGPISRGYREEMEDFAYRIRQLGKMEDPYIMDQDGKFPLLTRCHGEVAMADAILALTSNIAMKVRERIEFKPDWFKWDSPATPEDDYKEKLEKAKRA